MKLACSVEDKLYAIAYTSKSGVDTNISVFKARSKKQEATHQKANTEMLLDQKARYQK